MTDRIPKYGRKTHREKRILAHEAVFGPDRESTIQIDREGSNRVRIQISEAFQPFLTERQRTVLKGKVRVQQGWTRMLRMIEDSGMTMADFIAGLSVEELVRGQFKDKRGQFRGAPPKWVPREFHRACLAELMKRGQHMWQENYLEAIKAMTEIAAGKGEAGRIATPGERLKAAQFVVERMEGKVPERLIVNEERRWATVLDGIVAEASPESLERGRKLLDSAEASAQEIIDAEFEVIDDDEPPPPTRSRRRRAAKE